MRRRMFGNVLISIGFLFVTGSVIVSSNSFQLLLELPRILGFPSPQRYLVLFQNNAEIRPTGGFMGSYAIVTILKGHPTYTVEDIYVPDGKVTKHIVPPQPIQDAFALGTWRLRDANWNPDFPQTARTIEWFMGHADQPSFNGVIAVNVYAIERVLRPFKSIKLSDFNEAVTFDTIREEAQERAQNNFFPGSKQKKEFLADAAQSVITQVRSSSLGTKIQLLRELRKLLREKHIQLYFDDPAIEQAVDTIGWSGRVRQSACPPLILGCINDSLMVVEANLGVNKANCCIERSEELFVEVEGETLHHKLILTVKNYSNPERFGGTYKAWIRALHNGQETASWLVVPVGETKKLILEYDSPLEGPMDSAYVLTIQKQSGIVEFPLRVTFTQQNEIRSATASITEDTTIIL